MKDTEHPPGGGHEQRDVKVSFLAYVVVGLFLLMLAGMGVSWWYQGWTASGRRAQEAPLPAVAATLPAQPPEPRLQAAPATDLARIRAEEEALLHRYEWIDPKSGLVRIPIDRAMELVATRGLPTRPQPSGEKGKAGQ
jgi:hypothetical protein